MWGRGWAGDTLTVFFGSTFLSPVTRARVFLLSTGGHIWMGCWSICVYQTLSCHPNLRTGVTPGVQSCKTLTRGFVSLILGKRMICIHPPFCPVVCITEKSPFILAWKVTGLKRGTHGRCFWEEGRIFYKITVCHFCGRIVLSVSFLPPGSSPKVMCEDPPQEVPFGDLERPLPLLQRTSLRSPCGGCPAIICGFTQSMQIL